jgi:hypothetical protein
MVLGQGRLLIPHKSLRQVKLALIGYGNDSIQKGAFG